MNSLLDESVRITVDHTSETLIWRDQRGEPLGLATYDQLSETDIEWITLVERIRRHNQLLIEYFTLLGDLATSDTPEGAQESINNVAETLVGVGEDLKPLVPKLGEITQLIVSSQIRGALRDELEQRKDVIQYELALQELLLAKLAEQLKGRLTETREFKETRLIKPRLLAPGPMDIDKQQDWIDERRTVLSSQTTAEQLIKAKDASTKFRELFERFVEGGLTTSRINAFLDDIDVILEIIESSKNLQSDSTPEEQ